MYKTEADKIIIPNAYIDLKATIECGQFFRYQKAGDRYTVRSGEHACDAYVSGDSTIIQTNSTDFFVNFFNLDRDVGRIKRELSRFDELKPALGCCGMLRILHQPLFETIISFIISANNNIPRIKGIIERLCMQFDGVFPTPEQLTSLSIRQLDAIGCGYRSKYLLDTARICAETQILNKLYTASTADAQKMLMTLPGVGQKISDCVTLFALGRLEVFPVDTWIIKTMREGMETEMQLRARLMTRYGELSGYAQQYWYYYNAIVKPR